MAEKIGPIFNRILIKKLDQALENGSITKEDYDDLKKKYFGKPKLIQMDLFDPEDKKKGGLMEATRRLKAQGLRKGGRTGKLKMDPKRQDRPEVRKPKGLGPMPKLKRKKLTNQEKLDVLNRIKKSQGKMVDESLKVDNFGNFYYEAKKGGSMKKFPDLSGDGKVTMKDILMGRGVIKKPKKKASGGAVDTPRKKRGNYGPNIGKPFKAMGPVGGVPVNRSGTKIMVKAGRLAKRGYGIAKK
jgi:hypothetical protein